MRWHVDPHGLITAQEGTPPMPATPEPQAEYAQAVTGSGAIVVASTPPEIGDPPAEGDAEAEPEAGG